MDIYKQTLDYLFTLNHFAEWPELRQLTQKAADNRPSSWQLPLYSCLAVGGYPEQALPGVAALACAHLSIIMIDDLLDADPRGVHHQLGTPQTANLAAALQAASLEALTQVAQQNNDHTLLSSFNNMLLSTTYGQHLDIYNPADEVTYWRVVQTKSAPFFREALYIGASLGQATKPVIQQIGQLGALYGEMIQINDDIHDTLEVPANPDWTLGRYPLPLLYAHIVAYPDKDRFTQLRQAVTTNTAALNEAQLILLRSGAISYAVAELLNRHKRAQTLLNEINLVERTYLEQLFEGMIQPVYALLEIAQAQPLPPELANGRVLGDG